MFETEEKESSEMLPRLRCPIVANPIATWPFADPVCLLSLAGELKYSIRASSSLAHSRTMARWFQAGKARTSKLRQLAIKNDLSSIKTGDIGGRGIESWHRHDSAVDDRPGSCDVTGGDMLDWLSDGHGERLATSAGGGGGGLWTGRPGGRRCHGASPGLAAITYRFSGSERARAREQIASWCFRVGMPMKFRASSSNMRC